jgi:hypothetical protein
MKKALILLALLVPFFSQYSNASIFTDGSVETVPPDISNVNIYCSSGITPENKCSNALGPSGSEYDAASLYADNSTSWYTGVVRTNVFLLSDSKYRIEHYKINALTQEEYIGYFLTVTIQYISVVARICPPPSSPNFVFGIDFDDDGEFDACADPSSIPLSDSCNINDSPNVQVTDANACYTKSDGSQCSVTAVDVGGGNQVYQGSEGDCYSDPKPDITGNPQQGTPPVGNECSNNGGLLACPEDPQNVCGDSGSQFGGGSVNNCQAGCGYVNDAFMCYDTDIDGDGLPDYNDPDIDGDGIANGNDLDADGDGQDDPLNGNGSTTGVGSSVGSVDIDLSPVVSELKKLNSQFDKQTLPTFDVEHSIDALNTAYDTEMKDITNMTSEEANYVENISFSSQGFFSSVPADGCSVYTIPVGIFGNFSLDLCFVSAKVKPYLFYVFGFLTAFYVFITVNSTIRTST